MRVKHTKETKRITLDLSTDFFARLEALQTLLGSDTKANVIRQALQLYEFVAKRTAQGVRFQVVNEEGDVERLVLLDLLPPEQL